MSKLPIIAERLAALLQPIAQECSKLSHEQSITITIAPGDRSLLVHQYIMLEYELSKIAPKKSFLDACFFSFAVDSNYYSSLVPNDFKRKVLGGERPYFESPGVPFPPEILQNNQDPPNM